MSGSGVARHTASDRRLFAILVIRARPAASSLRPGSAARVVEIGRGRGAVVAAMAMTTAANDGVQSGRVAASDSWL